MKKNYIAPQNNVASTRIRASILAGSNVETPASTVTKDLNDASNYDQEIDGGLGVRQRITYFD